MRRALVILALGYLLGALTHDALEHTAVAAKVEAMPEPHTPNPDVVATLRMLNDFNDKLRIHAAQLKKLEEIAQGVEADSVEMFRKRLIGNNKRRR